MSGTVKSPTKIGIDQKLTSLRLQLVASEMGVRIGERIRQRRKELGLTQKQVAARMPSEAVDAQRISDWERAYNQPSARYVEELVAALELDDASYFYRPPDRPAKTPDLSLVDGHQSQLDRIEAKLDHLQAEAERRARLFDELVTRLDRTERRLKHMSVEEADEVIRLLQESRNRLGRDVGKRSLPAAPGTDHRAAQ